MNCLHNVTYGCTLVTHGASQRRRKSRASQSCAQFAAAIRLFAGCSRQDGSRVLCFPPPGISISSTSRTIETGCSYHRHQNCVYGKAFRKTGGTPAFICQCQRFIAQRYCGPCSGGFSPAEEEAWVNDHQVGATRSSWNIGLIVCYGQSWNRPMSCWCPTSDGQFKRPPLRRN
jgi:hypothetical protein